MAYRKSNSIYIAVMAIALVLLSSCNALELNSARPDPSNTPGRSSGQAASANSTTGSQTTLSISEPQPGAQLVDPVVVKGRGSAFENAITVEVIANGLVLGRSEVTTGAQPGQTGMFETTVNFTPVSADTDGEIEIFTTSPKDGTIDQQVSVPVRLVAHGPVTPTGILSMQPTIRISPPRGRAGTELTVVGAGFPPGSQVQIRLGGLTSGATEQVYATTEAGQHGNIQVSFIMPNTWPSGEKIVLPELLVLASTPDFLNKATANFAYAAYNVPTATPTIMRTSVAIPTPPGGSATQAGCLTAGSCGGASR